MKRSFIKCSLIILLLSVTALFFNLGEQQTAWASSGGRTGYSGNPATNYGEICTSCHSGGSVPTVTLTGPTSLATGESGTYTLTITGGAAVVGGLDVSTTGGTLQATGSNTKLSNGEITQTDSTAFSAGSLAFTFTLVAPSTAGTVTLYGTGLSADNNGSISGDDADGTTLAVGVSAAPAPNNPPSAPTLVSPTDGQTGVSTTVSLEWNKSTDPDNDTLTYHLYDCTDSTFTSCTPVNVASRGMAGMYLAGSGLLFFGFVFTRGNRGKTLVLMLMIAALLMTGALFTSCGKSSDSNTTATTQVTADMTHQASGLSSGTTYYWKVVADDGKGGLTSSATWSFTTQ
jgi:hypothetical protein